MHLFYTPDLKSDIYCLNETESRHCIKVLRLTEGDEVILIDGVGGFYTAEIHQAHQKRCEVRITNTLKNYGKRNYFLHIAIAPTKNIDRFEWFLEKATEIGIDEITPIITEHSERKVVKPERLNKIITSAVKQSIKAYHPQLNSLIKFKEFMKNTPATYDKLLIAHCEDSVKKSLKDIYQKEEKVLILIGPEGDFSPSEIKIANDAGFTDITMGESRLRTETAGIVACHSIAFIN